VAQTVTIGEQKICPESESLKFSTTPTPQVENPFDSDSSTPTPQPWFHVHHCSFKKHFRLGKHIMGALVKCSSLDEIGTIAFHVTVLCTATYEHATKSFEIIKAIIDENENPETMCGTEVL